MSYYNELPFVVVDNNGVDVRLYDIDLEKYIINEGKTNNNVSYVSLDGSNLGRVKTRPYAQYTSLTGRTGRSPVMLERRPDYFGCTLDKSFKTFDGWVSWAETKIGFMCTDENGNLYQLDKDLLNYPEKNREYNPKNCVFLPPSVNLGLGQLPRLRLLETKRKFFSDTFENYFNTLDEEALGKVMDICGHNYGLNKFEVTTETMLLLRSKYGSLFAKIDQWEDNIDVTNFSFVDGMYSYKSRLKVDRFTSAKEALLSRLNKRFVELETASKEFRLDKVESLGKWYRVEEVERMIEKKLSVYKNLISDVETRSIKLPHYVLTWV